MVYCEAKRIIESYENKEGSIQSLISKSPCQHKNSLTCLIMKTLCYQKILHKVIKRSKLLDREKFLGEKLAQLLVYDVLFGMGVRGKFKGTMKRNYTSLTETLEHYMKKYQVEKREDLLKIFENFNESSKIKKPKYIYLNTLQLSKKEILSRLKEQDFIKIKETEEQVEQDEENTNDIKKSFQNLNNYEFIKDEHVKNMYIFSHDSLLNKANDLFNEGHLLQIDKSSCLVPLALNPPQDAHVIDAAAAPGNKTILLANIMKNTGLIHAFDIDETRINLMTGNLKQHHVTNVRLKSLDFLQTEIEKYDRVTHVLLDVPCSGSGMTNRLKFGDSEREQQKDKTRLWNLEALQRRMLMHAMTFNNVSRIVYSTCSIHEEENENVVRYALKHSPRRFKLVNIFENDWKNSRGICKSNKDKHVYHLDYCIRTSYEKNQTNGFFISCFELDSMDELENHYDEDEQMVEDLNQENSNEINL